MAMAAALQSFIAAALREEQRVDGRRPFDSRRLNIKFSREDGTAEVQLGQTHVMCVVSGQLVQPFPDRPNEGTLAVFTEFSPMADPAFETGRPGESAVELGRVIDRGLRESRAVDMESLCVLAGKAVWSLRVDICILDNGGNLVDAANVAAVAALLSFRRPECTTGSGEGQEVVIHPPEIREPLPLILHHLPIAVTFAFFGDGDLVVMDPSYKEEFVMKGKLTVTMNVHGDICAIQKGGGVGVSAGEITRCLRIASTKVADITSTLKKAAEAHERERALRKIKRHNVIEGMNVDIIKSVPKDIKMMDAVPEKVIRPKLEPEDDEESSSDDTDDDDDDDELDSDDETITRRRVIKQEVVPPPLSSGAEPLFQGSGSAWEEGMKPSAAASTLAAKPRPANQSSFNKGKGGARSSCKEGGDGKPRSLLDAVKSNKKRKKKKRSQHKLPMS